MERFFYIIQMYREYILLAVLLAVSFLLFPLNDNTQIKQLRAYSIAGLGILHEPVSLVTESFTLRSENERLRRENIRLADEVYHLREARLENIRLRQMLQFRERTNYDAVAARVVGRSSDPIRKTLTLNIGAKHGIAENMPIISESGLVGKVSIVADNYSVGQVMLNRDFRASVRVERTGVNGILRWDGATGMVLDNVAKTLDVNEGDVIITSEYSNIFPSGIHVGVVSRVTIIPGSVTKDIHVQPGVDFSRLQEVFVMLYAEDEEKIDLENLIERR
jgi:rod shape-determining protein MreC